jgi:hypothetical protein
MAEPDEERHTKFVCLATRGRHPGVHARISSRPRARTSRGRAPRAVPAPA